MENRNRNSALFFIVLSIFICQQALSIGVGSLSQPGPGLLAFGAGAGILILAIYVLIHSFINKENRSEVAHKGKTLSRKKFLLICCSLFIYTFVVDWLGFLLPTFIFCIFVLRTVENEKWFRTLIAAGLLTIGNYLVFGVWLGLSLPKEFFTW